MKVLDLHKVRSHSALGWLPLASEARVLTERVAQKYGAGHIEGSEIMADKLHSRTG